MLPSIDHDKVKYLKKIIDTSSFFQKLNLKISTEAGIEDIHLTHEKKMEKDKFTEGNINKQFS